MSERLGPGVPLEKLVPNCLLAAPQGSVPGATQRPLQASEAGLLGSYSERLEAGDLVFRLIGREQERVTRAIAQGETRRHLPGIASIELVVTPAKLGADVGRCLADVEDVAGQFKIGQRIVGFDAAGTGCDGADAWTLAGGAVHVFILAIEAEEGAELELMLTLDPGEVVAEGSRCRAGSATAPAARCCRRKNQS